MRAVTGVLLDPEERQEVARAKRWIGVHPDADASAARSQKRAATVRQEIAGTLNSIADGTEPIFGERLDRAREYLLAILPAAQQQSLVHYWTARGCTAEQGLVLATARLEAMEDVWAALAVLDAARPYAAHVRDLVDEEEGPR